MLARRESFFAFEASAVRAFEVEVVGEKTEMYAATSLDGGGAIYIQLCLEVDQYLVLSAIFNAEPIGRGGLLDSHRHSYTMHAYPRLHHGE